MLRELWMRLILGLAKRRKRPANLNALYVLEDPWNMNSDLETYRFERTNAYILEETGHVGSMLEIGSGEGHQSEYLRKICDRLVGIEASEKAVERARHRLPEATFVVGDLSSAPRLVSDRFDLVVAFEVLYYLPEPADAVRALRQLGTVFVASCYHDEYARVAGAIFTVLPDARESKIVFGETTWHFFISKTAAAVSESRGEPDPNRDRLS